MTLAITDEEKRFYLTETANYYHPGRPGFLHPRTWDDGVMPLWEFPVDHLNRILDATEGRSAPRRWAGTKGLFQAESRSWYEWHWVRGKKLRADPDYVPRSRRHIPDAIRFAVYARDGWRCLHCGSGERLTLDHIYPYSLGGSDAIENLQTLCRPCNSRKGAKVNA